jgi:hypothetical protein
MFLRSVYAMRHAFERRDTSRDTRRDNTHDARRATQRAQEMLDLRKRIGSDARVHAAEGDMYKSQHVDRNADAMSPTKIAASKGEKFTAGAGFKSAVN